MRLLLLGLGFAFALPAWAQFSPQCVIYGNAPEYAGVAITLSTPSDFISRSSRVLATDTVGRDGAYRFEFSLLETRLLTMDLGVYTAYLYVSPGESMAVALPRRRDKREAERLNPYFEPLEVQLRGRGGDSARVNDRIARFDRVFEQTADSLFQRYSHGIPKAQGQKAYTQLLAQQSPSYQVFVNQYIRYRAGLFAYLCEYMRAKQLSETFFKTEAVLYANPAYMDLFNIVYKQYFILHGRTEQGKAIYQAVSKKRSLSELHRVLDQNDNIKQDSLREMVILKNLYDEFFSDKFSRKALLTILDSVYSTTTIPEHTDIANVIREKITRLLPGFIPHQFALEDAEGKLHTTPEYKGKLLLLNFCATSSYTSLQDFALLRKLKERLGGQLAVVCISTDRKYEDFQTFVRNTDFPFTFLYYGRQPQLLQDYDIRAYPTYFLLDESGRIILSPAPGPSEDLPRLLYEQYKLRGWPLPSQKRKKPFSRYKRGGIL